MKFIRHVLSHLLFISLLAGVCAIYFFRYELLPGRYTQKIDHYAEAIHPKLITIASKEAGQPEAQQEKVVQAEQEIDVIYVDDVPLVDDSSNNIATKEKTADAKKEVITTTKAQPEEQKAQQQVAQESIEDKPEQKETTDDKPAEVTKIQEEVVEVEENPVSEDKAAADYLTVLRDARTAFAQGNMETAVTKYNELIDLENDEADFHGELGNVYYAMGKWNEAGASYYEAAVRLIENKQMAQVSYLQRVIQGLDAERAEKLAKHLANRLGNNQRANNK